MRALASYAGVAIASALVSATLVAAVQAPTRAPVAASPTEVVRTDRGATYRGVHAARLSALEGRLDALERSDAGAGGVEAAVAEAARPPVEPERSAEQVLSQWSERLGAHDAALADASWAPEATRSFARDLDALSVGASFRFVEADCRTSTCTATVEFEDYDKAIADFESLLHHDYAVNCTRQVILPEPADPGVAYRARVLFDCANLRGS